MKFDSINIKAFDKFIGGLDLQYFQPYEIRVHCDDPRNGLPDKKLWPNIVSTLRTLEIIRAELGKTIFLNSVYRSHTYNAAISGSAANSNHMYFCACDWRVHGIGTNSFIRDMTDKIVKELLKNQRVIPGMPIVMAGRGFYPTKGFIHLDTNNDNGGRERSKLITWKG